MENNICMHQREEWLSLVGKYYDEYISECKCDPDECECLNFKNFEYKFLEDLEEQKMEEAL